MSLITNAVSPFTKTTPLVTLVLVAALFAVFRLSSGSVRITTIKDTIPNRGSALLSGPAPLAAGTPQQQRGPKAAQQNEDILRSLLQKRGAEKKQVRPAREPIRKEKQSGALDDIESALGLR
jgi:hypothetical protein